MHDPSESESRWGGDSNAEWMSLAVETADLGTWEFDLEQGTGLHLRAVRRDNGIPENFAGPVDSFRRLALHDPLGTTGDASTRLAIRRGMGELKMRLQLIDTGGCYSARAGSRACLFLRSQLLWWKQIRPEGGALTGNRA